MSIVSRSQDYITRDAMVSLATELRARLRLVLSSWQVQEYERAACAQSRREARIATVRGVILDGMIQEWDEIILGDFDDPLAWVETRLLERRKMLSLAGAD